MQDKTNTTLGVTTMTTINNLIRSETTYNRAVNMLHWGSISQRTFDWFCFFYDWAAPRYSGSASFKQERFYNRCGEEAYWRRIERVKALLERVRNGEVEPAMSCHMTAIKRASRSQTNQR